MRTLSATLAALLTALAAPALAGPSLDAIVERDRLICGANGSRAGFSLVGSEGEWEGMDVEVCRAIATAILGDPNKVEFVKVTSQTRFPALQTGEVDILTSNTTWTLSRDSKLGVDFVAPIFYDGQGFMLPKALGVSEVDALDGATICVLPGSTSEKVVNDVFEARGMSYTPVVIEDQKELNNAFFAGRCDAQVQSTSGLSASRATVAANPQDYVILGEVFSKDPMGPVVREDDADLRDIVAWTVYALMQAEEFGITQANVAQMASSDDPEIQEFLGATGDLGQSLGLDADWVVEVVGAVGNYGEIYERTLGEGSALGLSRGLNALWSDGGLHYPPPFK
ncbi:amino acid ABC transporter substrate-binding protein [Acuticoccus sp.]|uniref:amino acid ABC transporter substrate-binding protein n=1 Tax=Acuticoccus sp. TaxID=1904378 RepID=UPI003B51B1C7